MKRRDFLAGAASLGSALATRAWAECATARGYPLPDDAPSSWEEITRYNNFYEYSPDKRAVAHLARDHATHPWPVSIEGEVERARVVEARQLAAEHRIEQRIYRMRCIEGWSKVVPWEGIPLCEVLERARPTSKARFVEFVAPLDPTRFYGQRRPTLPWPYTEALTLAEAMHPLTILATGLHGKPLPNQNGAPIRLVVPWKYGFKSIKAIATIRLRETQPITTWPQVAREYGFYGNVNPRIAGARGSQSRENRVGELRKRETLLLNGYADQVAHLYAGFDLDKLL